MDQFRRGERDLRIWPRPWDAPSPPTDTRWVSTHGLDHAIGFYKHKYREYVDWQNPIDKPKTLDTVQHARRLLFVKPNFWIVQDTFTATDDAEHTCDVLFHINAEEAAVDPATNAVTSVCKDAPNVTIAPLNVGGLKAQVVKGKVEPPIQGWTNCGGKRTPDHPMAPIPTAILSRPWKKSADVLTVLYPFPAGAESPVKSVEAMESKDGVVAAKIVLDGGATHLYVSSPKPGETVELAGIKTDGEVAEACAQPGRELRLLLVNGTSLTAGGAAAAIANKGSVSVTGYADALYGVGCDVAAECSVTIPSLAEAGAIEVHKIDCDLNRIGKVEAALAGGALKFQTEAGGAYEIGIAGAKELKSVVAEQLSKGETKQVGLDYPVKPAPKLPPAMGVKVVVQAEDFAGQGGGSVTVTDKKVATDGKAFLNWDKPGHHLDYKFSVPADGEYWITLKYCSESVAPVRAVVLDGAFPAECMKSVALASTGGWSNDHDDWRLWTIEAPDAKKPFPFYLRQGEHVLRMVNVQDSLNLDFLMIHSPDVKTP